MTAFRIEIHESRVAMLHDPTWQRLSRVLRGQCPQLQMSQKPENRFVRIWEAEGVPPAVVTLVAALAMGHDLVPILDHYEAELVKMA